MLTNKFTLKFDRDDSHKIKKVRGSTWLFAVSVLVLFQVEIRSKKM